MSLFDGYCVDIILSRVGSFYWTPLLGVCLGSSLALLGMRLGVARVVSTRCFLSANGSWLSVSLKAHDLQHSPSVGGNDEKSWISCLQATNVKTEIASHSLIASTITPVVPAMAMPLTALRLIVPVPTLRGMRGMSGLCLRLSCSQL